MAIKPYVIVCDIDDVYTDSREWTATLPKDFDRMSRKVWDDFHSKCYLAKPNESMVKMLACINSLIQIFFVTAREDRYNMRDITIRQIEEFSNGLIKIDGIQNRLYMRAEHDFRCSNSIKEDILTKEILPYYNVAIAIDDDASNIEMYKKYEIPTKLYEKFRK